MKAVLALNSGKNECGEPNPETAARIDGAMRYAIGQQIGTIIMVGGDAVSMVAYAAEHFPEAPATLAEDESKDTLEGAHFVKVNFLAPNDIDEAHIFTQDFHSRRTDWIYRRVLGDQYSIQTHSVASNLAPAKTAMVRQREKFQLTVARLKLLGIGPNDDEKRASRLARVRYRDRDSKFAHFLTRADGFINVHRF